MSRVRFYSVLGKIALETEACMGGRIKPMGWTTEQSGFDSGPVQYICIISLAFRPALDSGMQFVLELSSRDVKLIHHVRLLPRPKIS
jgi:hypothetical protein